MAAAQLKKIVKKLPQTPGIYQFTDENGRLIYVGKAKSLRKRVASYFAGKNLGPKTNLLVKNITNIKIIKVFSEFEATLLEAQLIRDHQPFFNQQSKDDKSPIYIKITDDKIPIVQTTRVQKPQKGVFLKGPFPSSKTTRDILKITRRIFPYCHHKNPQNPCLFVHLGLCPYPYKSVFAKKQYAANIKRIKKLLWGKSNELISELKKDMDKFSKNQQYEKAGETKKTISQLEFLSTTYHAPKEFLDRPTLVDDISLAKLKSLKKVLGLSKIPRRIECYDISNISGKLATGSMVVFTNGQEDKDEYRRFKIRFSQKADDYQMLKEILSRRFKNEWQMPDLIIIDGGRGQLNSALSVLNNLKLTISVISLAKKFEEIYAPYQILPIKLPKESPARQLVQEIRDEAHRFAITYHKFLRSNELFN